MKKIEKDEVVFEFAHVKPALERCAEKFIKEWAPRVLAEDREAVIARLMKDMWFASDEDKQAFREKVEAFGQDEIATKYAGLVRSHCRSAKTTVDFQRTLRIPDDGNDYPLPPGLGSFPLSKIDGKTVMPMYQAEAMWMSFYDSSYPVALKIGTGSINAVNGEKWSDGLLRDPQSYVVLPEQPWLDGYCVEKGVIRQFVAVRLGDGYSTEEQLEGTEEGGIRLEAVPVNPEIYFEKDLKDSLPKSLEDVLRAEYEPPSFGDLCFSLEDAAPCAAAGMGLGAGGRMKQDIYEDQWEAEDWDLEHALEKRVEICDAVRWFDLMGQLPPTKPVTAKTYSDYGMPWFDYYRDDMKALETTGRLAQLKSVQEKARDAGDVSVPEDETSSELPVIPLGPS